MTGPIPKLPLFPAEDDPTRPERDLSGLHGFGLAPPVAQEIQVYIDLQLVDAFPASRAASLKELMEEVQHPPARSGRTGRPPCSENDRGAKALSQKPAAHHRRGRRGMTTLKPPQGPPPRLLTKAWL